MSLWADKYRPKNLGKLNYHKEQAEKLKKLISLGDFPHLLVYGPSGAGKKTRIMCLLKELYGPGVERLRMQYMNFTTPSKKKLEVMSLSSNYHIEINPSDVGIYDRVVVMDLIKNMAQTQQLDINGQRPFKIVILTGADDLTKEAQHALRRTMEKYIANCRLILCATSTSNIIPAIRSRCLSIRIPAPKVEDIVTILQNICKKEGLSIPTQLAQQIAEKSNRNLRRALLMCEACKVEQYPFSADQNVTEPDWLIFIRHIAKTVSEDQSIKVLASVRGDLYELIAHGIPSQLIFKTLVTELIKDCNIQLKAEIVKQAAFYEHRLQQGNKAIFHLEAFLAKVMSFYKQLIEDAIDKSFQ